MAKLVLGNRIPSSPMFFVSDIYATSERLNDAAFDSELSVSNNPNLNCTLRLKLRIFLNQIRPWMLSDLMAKGIAAALGVPIDPKIMVSYYADTDGRSKLIKDWQGTEWIDFIQKFIIQADIWSRKFWLLPPDNFSLFDITQGSSTFRPNVTCELEVFYTAAKPHRIIDVVNLYSPDETFRSNSNLYSVKDIKTKSFSSQDIVNQLHSSQQSTVVHEIGHAIGLPHIGVFRSLPQCNLAIAFKSIMPGGQGIPAFYKGGSNAIPCYGDLATYGDIDNIMGSSDKFAPENAKPWLDRLEKHILMPIDKAKWMVSLNEVPPMSLIGFRK